MEKLGIQLPVLLAQLVNFGLLLVILNKFLYKPMLSALDARRKKIDDGLHTAKVMEEEKKKLEKKSQEIVDEAKKEAAKILAEAKKTAKAEADAIKTQAHEEARTDIEKLEKELRSKYQNLEQSLSSETVDLAAKMVEKLLGESIDAQTQEKLIEKQLKKLKSHYE